MGTIIESPVGVGKDVLKERESILIDKGEDLYIVKGMKREFAYITSINFTPVIAVASSTHFQVFPISQLSEEDQIKLHQHENKRNLQRRIHKTSYSYEL